MVYKIAIDSRLKQLFQTWKTSSFMKTNTLTIFAGSHHEYTFSWPTAVGNSADWPHLSTFPPVEDTLSRHEYHEYEYRWSSG